MDILSGFIDLLTDLIWLYLFILLGITWRFSRFYRKKYADLFTKITIWILFPISIISSFAKVDTFGGLIILQIAVIAIIVHLGGYYIYMFFTRKEKNSPDKGAIALTATFPNSLIYPFPIIIALEQILIASSPSYIDFNPIYFATLFVFFTMVIRNSFGMYIGTQFNNNSHSEEVKTFQFKKLIIDMCKFPPLLAVIAGFILHSILGPEAIDSVPGLEIFKTIALYGSLLLVGVSFQDLSDLHPSKLFSKSTYHVSGIRFIVAPLLAIIPIFLFKFEPIIAIPILIQSMAPPAVSNIIYGTFFKLNESLTSTLITIVTLLALLILPFELLLFFALFSV